MPKSKSINKTESFVDLDAKEEDIYESIARELDKKKIKKGVWAKATAEADGDENKTKAIYIRYRYSQLIKNSEKSNEEELKFSSNCIVCNTILSDSFYFPYCSSYCREKSFFFQLKDGDFGLRKTFWIYFFIPSLFFSIFTHDRFYHYIPENYFPLEYLVVIAISGIIILPPWSLLVGLGLWNSSKRYKGKKILSIFGYVIGAIQLISSVLGGIYAIKILFYN